MAVPSSNIRMTDIYQEANVGSPPSDLAVSDLFLKSYFESIPFGGALPYNAWGQYGSSNGADRIYGLSASSSNNNFNQFANKVYFYDNSTYGNYADIINNLPPPTTPPDPPDKNDLQFNCYLKDSTGTYTYSQFQTLLVSNGGSASQIFSNTTEPILAVGYWEVIVTPTSGQFGGGLIDIYLNNTAYVSGGIINAIGPTTFNFGTYGSVNQGSSSSGYIGVYFDIQAY